MGSKVRFLIFLKPTLGLKIPRKWTLETSFQIFSIQRNRTSINHNTKEANCICWTHKLFTKKMNEQENYKTVMRKSNVRWIIEIKENIVDRK